MCLDFERLDFGGTVPEVAEAFPFYHIIENPQYPQAQSARRGDLWLPGAAWGALSPQDRVFGAPLWQSKILLRGLNIESSRARQSKVEDESPNRCDDPRCYEIENRQNDESHCATFVNFV